MLNLWNNFIGSVPTAQPFEMFSRQHFWIRGITAIGVVLSIYAVRHSGERVNKYARYSVATIIIIMELLFQYWHLHIGNYSWGRDLPFDLCTISQVLIVVLLLKPSRYWSEILFFWAFTGALQALLTPGFEYEFGFPHFRFWNYFVCHALIIWAACYFAFVQGFRPYAISLLRSFFWLNVLAFIVGFINIATHGNYMYLCYKPATGSLLDFFGPWPWYIIGTELMGLLMFVGVYAPFYIYDTARKRYLAHYPERTNSKH